MLAVDSNVKDDCCQQWLTEASSLRFHH